MLCITACRHSILCTGCAHDFIDERIRESRDKAVSIPLAERLF